MIPDSRDTEKVVLSQGDSVNETKIKNDARFNVQGDVVDFLTRSPVNFYPVSGKVLATVPHVASSSHFLPENDHRMSCINDGDRAYVMFLI